jgi:hypothetical protein
MRPYDQEQRDLTSGAMALDPSAADHQTRQRTTTRRLRWDSRLRINIAMSVSLFVLSLGVCLYQARTNSVWLDEALSVGFSQLRWPVLWHFIWGAEANMGLYYVLLRGWIWALGVAGLAPTESVIRLPSLICVALSSVVVFQFGQRFVSKVAGISGALLFLTSFLALVQGDEARAYGPQLLLVCASWYALVAALADRTSRRWWVLYVVFATLQVYVQVFSLVIVGAQLIAFVCLLALGSNWRARAMRAAPAMAVSTACISVLVAPIVYDVLLYGGGNDWIPPAYPSDLVALFNPLGGGIASLAPLLFAIGLLELAIVLLALAPASGAWADASSRLSHLVGGRTPPLLRDARAAKLPLAAVALACWLILPLLIAYLLTQPGLNAHLFHYSNFAVCVPAYCLLVGLCVAITRWRFVQVILVAILLIFSLRTLPTARDSANYDAWRAPALWLEQHYAIGDGLVCVPDTWCAIPMDYYLLAYRSQAHFDGDSPGAWDWAAQTTVPTTADTLAAYASQHNHIFLVSYSRYAFGGTSAQAQQLALVEGWLDSHYQRSLSSSSSTYLSTITVTLFTRDSSSTAVPPWPLARQQRQSQALIRTRRASSGGS